MKTGLLLIDFQNDYFQGGSMELVGMEDASLKAGSLLKRFRDQQWPTIHIQHIASSESATFFAPGTGGVEIHESVKPLPSDTVIQKQQVNSFRDTSLLEELKSRGIQHLVICGAMSHMCVDATVRAAADHGFQCTLIHDACATKDLQFGEKTISAGEVHASFMAALGAAYADVISLKEFQTI